MGGSGQIVPSAGATSVPSQGNVGRQPGHAAGHGGRGGLQHLPWAVEMPTLLCMSPVLGLSSSPGLLRTLLPSRVRFSHSCPVQIQPIFQLLLASGSLL